MALTNRIAVRIARPMGARGMASQGRLPPPFGIFIVPQQSAWIVERFGRFHTVLESGLHFRIPLVDRVAYTWSLKEQALAIANQAAVTKDNVTIQIDGVLYLRVKDPEAASYGVEDAVFALQQLAQTTMRSVLGRMSLDETFEQRERINEAIVATINEAAEAWGVECLRYEIRDILPPAGVRVAMDMQAEAERRRRAEITEADGRKKAAVLQAEGEAQAIFAKAEATAKAIQRMSHSVVSLGGKEVVALRLAEQYVDSFGKLAKQGTTLVLPADAGNPATMVGSAVGVYDRVLKAMGSSNQATEAAPASSSSDSAPSPPPAPPAASSSSSSSSSAASSTTQAEGPSSWQTWDSSSRQ